MYPPKTGYGSFPRVLFTALLLTVVAVQAIMTWPVQSAAYVLPAYVLAPTFILLLLQLVMDMRGFEPSRSGNGRRGAAEAVLWLLLMPVLLALSGLVVAAGLYTLVYLRRRSAERWSVAIIGMISASAVLAILAKFLNKPQLFSGPFW